MFREKKPKTEEIKEERTPNHVIEDSSSVVADLKSKNAALGSKIRDLEAAMYKLHGSLAKEE